MSIVQGSTGRASTHAETTPDVGQLLEEERARVHRRDEEIRALKKDLKRHQEEARRYKEMVKANAPKDSVSESDVIQTVVDFNARIAEYADDAVKGLEFGKVTPPRVSLEVVKGNIGERMRDILASVARGSYKSVGVQFALQAIFIKTAYSTIHSWSSDPGQNAALECIYDGVIEHETHNASAQWRALTRRHATHLQSSPEQISETMSELAEHVHRAAGGSPGLVPDELRDNLRAKLGEIGKICVLLREQTSEGAFRIVAPRREREFSSGTMKAAKVLFFRPTRGTSLPEENTANGSPVVLCTTALGLRRSGETEAVVKAKVVQAVTDMNN